MSLNKTFPSFLPVEIVMCEDGFRNICNLPVEIVMCEDSFRYIYNISVKIVWF